MILPSLPHRPALAAALALLAGACADEAPAPPPNLVLITVDTLRADHLGAYGHERATSPNLDALADDGVRFDAPVAPSPWTLPSLTSIHTGLYPSEHGAVRKDTRLADETGTLAEALQGAGYRTIGLVANVLASEQYGLDRGFDHFDASPTWTEDPSGSSELLTHLARGALDDVVAAGDEPFFLWVHYFDPHSPYLAHPRFCFADPSWPAPLTNRELTALRTEIASLPNAANLPAGQHARDLYDEEVAHTDEWIGVLLEALEAIDSERVTVIAMTSDHGEAFYEHEAFGHGKWVYDELVRLPLILGGDLDPGLAGTVVEAPV